MAKAARKPPKSKAKSVKAARKPARKARAAKPLHNVHFPNEPAKYRSARDNLLRAEMDLRVQVERVAALRRKLPMGGEIPQDYTFDEIGPDGATRQVKLSELFGDKDTLIAYSFMYGPNMKQACPMCTSMLDGLNGNAPHVAQRVALAVIAKSPIARIREFAGERGWSKLRLVSSHGNSYNADYQGETAEGSQMPALNIFVRKDGKIRHFFCTEMLFPPSPKGMNARHVDMIWPLWNVLDFTPGGRGADWYPKLSYAG
jgi:predicted dithiol-disulfide oxidoreductase (DUF899 family)